MAKKKKIMKEFRLDEISIVDHPAQQPARITLAKRGVTKAVALTAANEGHAHAIVTADQKSGSTSYVDEHVHDWIIDDAGTISIADAAGHTHSIDRIVKGLTEEQLAILVDNHKLASESADAIGKSGGKDMTDQNKQSAEELAAAQKEIQVLKAKLAKAELSAEEKELLKGMDEAGQEKFMAMDDAGRKAELAKAQDADPVVYETEDGLEIRKSAGDVVLSLAKKADEERKARQELEKQAAEADLAKRAGEMKLPGELDAKKALLKAVDSLDEGEKKAAMELLNTNTERLALATERVGTTKGDDSDPIEGIAKRLREADPKLTKEQAYANALQTPEGMAAFTKMRSV